MLNYIYLYLKKCTFFIKKIFYKKFTQLITKRFTLSNFLFIKNFNFNKKTFFKSIKKLFFFKDKNMLFKRKWRFLKTRKLKLITINLIHNKYVIKKKHVKRRFSFFLPIKVFKNKFKTCLNVVNCFFKKSIRDNKLFFKKPSVVNGMFFKSFFKHREVFSFLFKFSNLNYLKLIQNKKIVIFINNTPLFPNSNILFKTGDVVKFSFNDKFLYKILKIYLVKYRKSLGFFKIKTKFKNKKFRTRFSNIKKLGWIARKVRRFNKINSVKFNAYWQKQNEIIYKNIDFSFLNMSFIYLFNLNFFKFNTIFKKLLNLYSWRLYQWTFK